MNEAFLRKIADNILADFLHTIGIQTEKSDMEIKDFGPFRIFTAQVRIPNSQADTIDPGETLDKLVSYMDHHNALPTAVRFQAYNVQVYVCPCGCGTFLYASIYHTA